MKVNKHVNIQRNLQKISKQVLKSDETDKKLRQTS